jgi:hypothetical protein
MTPLRIGWMSSGGDLVSFVSRYAGGLFAARLAPVMPVWTGSIQVVDTGRKAQFDKEYPGYFASGAKSR